MCKWHNSQIIQLLEAVLGPSIRQDEFGIRLAVYVVPRQLLIIELFANYAIWTFFISYLSLR